MFLSKLRAYLKTNIQSSTTYPGMIFIWMFETFFLPFTMLLIWYAIMASNSQLSLSRSSLTTYYILFPLVTMITGSWHGIFFAGDVRTGNINHLLLKPVFPFIEAFANNFAEKIIKIFFIVPLVAVGWMFFPPKIDLHFLTITLFFLTLIFSFLLTFVVNTCMGLCAFWLDEVSSLSNLLDISDYTFGGYIVPIFLYSPLLKSIATILPFRYMSAFSLEIISNSINQQQILSGIIIQVCWIIGFTLLSQFMWHFGIKKYQAFGG